METPTVDSEFEVAGIRFKVTSVEDKIVEVAYKDYNGIIVIPSTVDYNGTTYAVTSIGENVFYWCSGLKSIVIPDSVTSIGENVFYWCSGLRCIISHIPADKLFPTDVDVFKDIVNCTLYVPKGAKEVYAKADGWCDFENIVEFTETPTFEVVGIYFKVTSVENKTVEVAHSYKSTVVIPSTVDYNGTTYAVTSIGEEAFEGCIGLESIVIPNSVTSIGKSAFHWCSGLTSIVIPNSVTAIGDKAFHDCYDLTEVIIPNSVTSIGEKAFSGSGLTSIVIPDSVTSIGEKAFYNCSGLKSVVIPNSVTEIGNSAFSRSGLKSIKVESGNSKYDSRENCNAIIETETNTLIAGCQNTVIPVGVTSIGESAFYECSGLTSIVIPDSVTDIGKEAFYGSGLKSIVIPNSVTEIGNSAFYGSGLKSIVIPNSVTEIEDETFGFCSGLKSIVIADSVTSIGERAFDWCEGLKRIVIPNSVTEIGEGAFEECSGLKSITCYIPAEKLFPTEEYVFYGIDKRRCTLYVQKGAKEVYTKTNGWRDFKNIVEFTETPTFVVDGIRFIVTSFDDKTVEVGYKDYKGKVVIPLTVDYNGTTYVITSIGDKAFYWCKELESIVIPDSVTSIGDEAFRGSGLNSITIPNSVTEIRKGAFAECSGLTSIVIPNNVTSIGKLAFYRCSGLKSIVIPNSVTSIGEGAFCGCSSLKSIVIPNSVSSIGEWAFRDCSGLGSIVIPDSVTSIGEGAFAWCSGLTSIVIPNSVTSIGNSAFSSSGLESVVIPNSVTSIGEGAFECCGELESIVIPNSVTEIGYCAFARCWELNSIISHISAEKLFPTKSVFEVTVKRNCTLYVPKGAKEVYANTNGWKDFENIVELTE